MWLWIGIGRSISVPEFVFADEADWNKRLNLDLGGLDLIGYGQNKD